MLQKSILPLAAALGLTATVALPASAAESSALLDVLVRKKIITEKEAAAIQDETTKEEQAKSANKIKLSNSVSELKLYGDLRLRYQYENKDPQVDPFTGSGNGTPTGAQRGRWRFRLRLDAEFKLGEDWFGGVELQTAYASDSANQTFENGFTDYPIFISKAYLGYRATEWLTLTGGKFSNPFYTTDLVWDPDINPTGISEQIAFHKIFSSGDQSPAGYAKDGKTVAPVAPKESPWEFTLVAGQFIFDDNLEGGGKDPGVTDKDSTTDAYLFETQLIASYKFNKDVKLTVAPAWLVYSAGSFTIPTATTDVFGEANNNSFLDSGAVSGATRNLSIIQAPGDLSFKLGGVKTKFYWDFAWNTEGKSRVEDIYHLEHAVHTTKDPNDFKSDHSTRDDFAWLAGLQFGENKKRGDWSLLANYRETGIGSVDPNLNDSDFALGELNTRGVKVGLAYNVADFAVFSVIYMHAWNLRQDLFGGEATGGNGVADSNAVQVLQVDLNVKF
ncbi:MAG: hypothetical protein QOE70_1237 [Chthoniobacter sp.]|jgi:hypothetical protein|nr:hypothetical protein [Chthoniobacter sp.]